MVINRYNQKKREGTVLVSIEAEGSNEKEEVFSFRDQLMSDEPFKDIVPTEHDLHWNNSHRKTEKAYRNKGVGEFFFALREEIIKRITEKNPELKAEFKQINIDVPSVAKMIVDQKWLRDHGLEIYAKKHGVDFGYIPISEDETQVKELFKSKATQVNELNGEPLIKFIKKF